MKATWMYRMHLLASGAVTLGVLQAIRDIDFNQIWFQLLTTLLNLIITLVLGGSPTSLLLNNPNFLFV